MQHNDLYKVKQPCDTAGDTVGDTYKVYGPAGELPLHKRTGKNSYFVCVHGSQVNINRIPEQKPHAAILDSLLTLKGWDALYGGY